MVSNRRLADRKTMPRACGPVMIDCGGFSELLLFGEWRTAGKVYAALGRRYVHEIGNVQWMASQDLMCEPFMLQKTGMSVRTHQAMTVAGYLELLDRAPDLPWLPVLQGWSPADYFRHVEMYAVAGVNLADVPLVGLGSVCRRQHLTEARYVARQLASDGLRLHGFGVKTAALTGLSSVLTSSDSMAWSQDARRESSRRKRFGKVRIECPAGRAHTDKTGCNGCLPYALAWRERVLSRITGRPTPLFDLEMETV